MNLNKSGLVARFYMWSWGRDEYQLPNNFCKFFWQVVLATVLLPLTVWSIPFQRKALDLDKNTDWVLGVRAIIPFVLALFLSGVGLTVQGIIAQPIVAISIILAVPLITIGVYLVFRRKSFVRQALSEVRDITREKINSVKDGYCPKIEWK